MNNEELKNWYVTLEDSRKQVYLAFISNQLTIHGRAFGVDLQGEKQAKAFQGLNELQHQISLHIALIGLGAKRYPDEVLWQILHEIAAAYGLSAHLTQSVEHAQKIRA